MHFEGEFFNESDEKLSDKKCIKSKLEPNGINELKKLEDKPDTLTKILKCKLNKINSIKNDLDIIKIKMDKIEKNEIFDKIKIEEKISELLKNQDIIYKKINDLSDSIYPIISYNRKMVQIKTYLSNIKNKEYHNIKNYSNDINKNESLVDDNNKKNDENDDKNNSNKVLNDLSNSVNLLGTKNKQLNKDLKTKLNDLNKDSKTELNELSKDKKKINYENFIQILDYIKSKKKIFAHLKKSINSKNKDKIKLKSNVTFIKTTDSKKKEYLNYLNKSECRIKKIIYIIKLIYKKIIEIKKEILLRCKKNNCLSNINEKKKKLMHCYLEDLSNLHAFITPTGI